MLYRALLALLASSLLACIPPQPVYSSYTTASSSYISKISSGNSPGAPAPAVVDRAIGLFLSACGKRYGESKCAAAIKPVTLTWSGVVAPSPSTGALNTVTVLQGTLYSGLTVGYTVSVAWRGKISRSALIHELCHVIGTVVVGDSNANHTNVALKDLEAEANTAVAAAGL